MTLTRSRKAVVDFTEDFTAYSLTADATILSRTVSLPPGTYVAIAKVRLQSATVAGSPGYVYLRKAGSQIGSRIDLRTRIMTSRCLFGHFTHDGGSVTIDIFFDRESGTNVFGIAGDAASSRRFGQALLLWRVGI